jgi:hypothetical protein
MAAVSLIVMRSAQEFDLEIVDIAPSSPGSSLGTGRHSENDGEKSAELFRASHGHIASKCAKSSGPLTYTAEHTIIKQLTYISYGL